MTILTSGIATILSFLISFILTPYITNKLGVEAYGFVTLAKNFTQYATIITIALNSYAARYITVSYHNNDMEKAQEYISSVYYGDVAISAVIMIVAGGFILFLDRILNVSLELVISVKLLFLFVFLGFVLTTVGMQSIEKVEIEEIKRNSLMENGKLILDACCGSRMFWFDKHNPLALFVDKRSEIVTAKDRDKIRTIEVKPDIIADFTNLPFEDSSFYMVVFDPPHLKTLGKTSWMAKKYGRLPDNWQEMIKSGFDECMRVLKPYGTLVFKWNESEIKAAEVLSVIPFKPLFGHTTGRQSKTIWMCFMKLPIN